MKLRTVEGIMRKRDVAFFENEFTDCTAIGPFAARKQQE